MSTITPSQQAEVKLALQLSRQRTDRLEKAIMEAIMWLGLNEHKRATEALFQALNS